MKENFASVEPILQTPSLMYILVQAVELVLLLFAQSWRTLAFSKWRGFIHTCFGAVHEQKRELTLAVCTPDCPHLICKLKIEWKRTLKHNFIQFSNRKFFSCLLVLYLEFWFGLLRVKIKIKCYVVKSFADIFCYSNFKVRSGSVRSGSILWLFKLFETTNCTSIWS